KFDGKADEGVLVGYSIRNGPKWLFDIDSLTNTMSYHPVSAGNRANVNAVLMVLLLLRKLCPHHMMMLLAKKINQEPANEEDHTLKDDVDDMLHQEKMATKHSDDARSQFEEECDAYLCKGMRTRTSSTNIFNTVRTPLNTTSASRTSYPTGTSSEPQLMPIDGSFSIDINDYPDDPL
ncbi:hypothetical protein Tco_0076043, partial [Tanacetum coccineum]